MILSRFLGVFAVGLLYSVNVWSATLAGMGNLLGDNDLTIVHTDTEQLEFLDITRTLNMDQLEALGAYRAYGFTIAASPDVDALFAAFGFSVDLSSGDYFTRHVQDADPVESGNFVDHLGMTGGQAGGTGGNLPFTQAHFYFGSEYRGRTDKFHYFCIADRTGGSGNCGNGFIRSLNLLPGPTRGTLLVRSSALPSPVPLPAAAWLFASGLTLVAGVRRRR